MSTPWANQREGCLQRTTHDGRAGCMQFLPCYPRISPTVNTVGASNQPVRLALHGMEVGRRPKSRWNRSEFSWFRTSYAGMNHVIVVAISAHCFSAALLAANRTN